MHVTEKAVGFNAGRRNSGLVPAKTGPRLRKLIPGVYLGAFNLSDWEHRTLANSCQRKVPMARSCLMNSLAEAPVKRKPCLSGALKFQAMSQLDNLGVIHRKVPRSPQAAFAYKGRNSNGSRWAKRVAGLPIMTFPFSPEVPASKGVCTAS